MEGRLTANLGLTKVETVDPRRIVLVLNQDLDLIDAAIGAGGGGGGGAPSGPAGGDLAGSYPNPQIAAGVITDADVAAANKDGAAGVPSLRTLGAGAVQAAAGDHAHAAYVAYDRIDAKGDLLAGLGPDTLGRVALAASNGWVLTANSAGSTGMGWAPPTGFANPMTAPADLITGGASGAPTRLGVGGAGQVLTVVGGVLAWADGTPGPAGPPGPAGVSAGKILYYAVSDASDIAGYKTLLTAPSAAAEQTLVTTCTGVGVDFPVASFATDPGVIGAVDYPAGTAFRRIYARVNSGTARLHLQVFRRDAAGVETVVRDELSPDFTDQVVALQEWIASAPNAGTLLATDRIVNKIYAQRVTGGGGTVQVTTYYEGSSHGSHIQTTISSGAQGPPGPAGPGVAAGGTAGQVLTKSTAVDYDAAWRAPAAVDNLLANPGFEVWQRGAGPFTASTAYTADRWDVALNAGSSGSVTREAAIVDAASLYALACAYTHAAGGSGLIRQRLEDFYQVRGRTVACRVRVRSTVAGTVKLRLNDGTTSYDSAYNATTGWETLALTVAVPASATALVVQLRADVASCTFQVDNATLVAGSAPVDYVPLHPAQDLGRCQRYYQEIGGLDPSEILGTGQNTSTTAGQLVLRYPVETMATPTVTISAPGDWQVASASGAALTLTALSAAVATRRSCRLDYAVASGLVAGNAATLRANATAAARIRIESNPP